MTQDRPPRYAIYFTPDPESPLARFGAGVIGYDSDGGHDVTRIPLDAVSPAEVVAATQAPRHYGFHATLVAPFEHNGLSFARALRTSARRPLPRCWERSK
jgi:hypothetical protein